MAARGQIYSPKRNYPPNSPQWHRLVILSPTTLMSSGGNNLFVMAAVIRSRHAKVNMVMGHSIPIPANVVPCLPLDSVVETHQLFSLLITDLTAIGHPDGILPPPYLQSVLEGARRLFT
jgi:hypothetical protein